MADKPTPLEKGQKFFYEGKEYYVVQRYRSLDGKEVIGYTICSTAKEAGVRDQFYRDAVILHKFAALPE